jgi:hypothetical protein
MATNRVAASTFLGDSEVAVFYTALTLRIFFLKEIICVVKSVFIWFPSS